jgi:nitrite reductase/ring-hydroxylating ferredoxin subunit
VTVASIEDVPAGPSETLCINVDCADVIVVNVADRYVAIGAECANAGCMLNNDAKRDEQQRFVICVS